MTDTLTLTRFDPSKISYPVAEGEVLHGVFIDAETTGLDTSTAKIIQLAMTPFTFTLDGVVHSAGMPYVGLEDPGFPIPPEITRLTGIEDEHVKGEKLSYAKVGELMQDVALVVAHNAEYDRPVFEKRFPAFEHSPWACSMVDVPWSEASYASGNFVKLEWLAFKHCGMFFDAHRADLDCQFGVYLLSTGLTIGMNQALPVPSCATVLQHVLDAARSSYVRIYAMGAAFDLKDTLKARGYRWSSGEKGFPKAWYMDVRAREAAVRSELVWLKENVPCEPRGTQFDAFTRFSARVETRTKRLTLALEPPSVLTHHEAGIA